MSTIVIENFQGGLNLDEPSNIEDNEFESLLNMFYSSDKRIQTRRGTKTFGDLIGTTPITSLFSFKNETTGDTFLFAVAGDTFFEFDEGADNFISRKTGLDEFEADGVTRTRWTFVVYLNKVYLCDGINDYAEYDPDTNIYTELGSQPKVRHLAFLGDAIYGGGADEAPNTLFFSSALPINGTVINSNNLFIGDELEGRIQGLEELQQSVLVFKDKKVYNVSGDGISALALDLENGGYGDRAIERVGNGILYYNDRGTENLQPRGGTSGGQALQSTPLSDNVRQLFAQVRPKRYDLTIGEYILSLTNYYVTFDLTDSGKPNTTLVYSTLTKAWSQYTYPAINDYIEYEDSEGDRHFLTASANTGQVFEIETGFDDLGQPIRCEVLTKKWDFGDPTRLKTSQYVDIVGLKSIGGEIEADVLVEGVSVSGTTITDDFIDKTSTIATIGTNPIGVKTIGGGGGVTTGGLDLFRYFVRIPFYSTGQNIQIKLSSNSGNFSWTLERIVIDVNNENIEVYPFNNIG